MVMGDRTEKLTRRVQDIRELAPWRLEEEIFNTTDAGDVQRGLLGKVKYGGNTAHNKRELGGEEPNSHRPRLATPTPVPATSAVEGVARQGVIRVGCSRSVSPENEERGQRCYLEGQGSMLHSLSLGLGFTFSG